MSTSLGTANSSQFALGGGAQFWVYLSPQNNTVSMISKWRVTFSQGSWSGVISSDNPTQQLQTNNLSGIFDVKVEVFSGSTNSWRQVPPMSGSNNEIGCNNNCAAMVGIVADSVEPPLGAINAHFWTTWDALCKQS